MLGIEYGHYKAIELEQERRALEDKLCTVHYDYTFYGYQIRKISGILCEDGKRRTAVVRGEPDSWFTQPAYVRVAGKTVSGFITTRFDGALGGDRRIFIAYKYGRNGWLLAYSVDGYEIMQRAREDLVIDNYTQENCPKCGAILYYQDGYARCCGYHWPSARLREHYGDQYTLEVAYEWVRQREVEILEEDAACQSSEHETTNGPATGLKSRQVIGLTRHVQSIYTKLASIIGMTCGAINAR